ncbi:hypothetical protein, partial [Neisseria polysaccharea]|uniref:hypothetical protein n=1 Tax=Neisseria polysaccharea TaxID=489 RepID=UPI0014797064
KLKVSDDSLVKPFFLFNQFFREYGKDKEQTTMPLFPLSLFHHSCFHAVIPAKTEKSKAETHHSRAGGNPIRPVSAVSGKSP